MTLWKTNDDANGAPLFVGGLVNLTPNSANRDTMYGNTTANSFVLGKTVGVWSVSDVEKASANASSEAGKAAHTGWQLRTEGTGGRAGRIHYETLVAGGTSAGANTTFDDAILPDL